MKIEYLQKIIIRIQNQICCPKCKSKFAQKNIDINEVRGNLVEFSAHCEKCKARSHISAEIGVNQKISKPIASRTNSFVDIPEGKITQEKVAGLGQDLKGFKGHDIKSLFKF